MLYYKKTDKNLKKNTKSHKRSKRRNNNINDLMIMGYDDNDDDDDNDNDNDNDNDDDENIITKPTNISLQDFIKDTELNSYDECICYFCTNRIDFYNFNYYNMQDLMYEYDDDDYYYDNDYYDYDYHDMPELESISDSNSECSTYEGDSNISDSDIENI